MNSTIRTNMDSVRNYNIFTKNQTAASNAMTRATTGLRIASVQDGPADWAVSEKMRERINSLNQASQNVQNDTAMMKTAADGIANTVEIIRTLKARVLNAANASTAEEDRDIIANEINGLLKQIDENSSNVKYNGLELLGGNYAASDESDDEGDGGGNSGAVEGEGSGNAAGAATVSLSFQVGDASGMVIDVNIGDLSLKGLGLASEIDSTSLVLPTDTDDSDADAGGVEGDDNNGDAGGTIAAPSDSNVFIEMIDEALNRALKAATNVGSIEQRLGYTADNVATQIENLQASDSTIRDSDLAKEISDYMKWSVLSQASQYMLAQSNQNAFSVLNLLQ